MNHVSPASQAAVSFASAFAGFCRERTGDAAWLREHRELAFADFVQIGLPTRKHEDWRYTSLRSLAEGAFSLAPQDDVTAEVLAPYVQAGDITLVLVNGRLVTPLEQLGDLPTGLLIAPLADALSVNVPAALRLLKRYATAQQPFSQLNEAFLASGLFIEWNPGVTCERRIHIIHVGSGKDRLVTLPRHMLVLGADAKGEVVETFISIDEGTTSFTCRGQADVAVPKRRRQTGPYRYRHRSSRSRQRSDLKRPLFDPRGSARGSSHGGQSSGAPC